MSIDHPTRLLIGVLAIVAFALLYDRLQRRATARDLAYSNVAFFAARRQAARVDTARARKRSGWSRWPWSRSPPRGRT